MKRASLAVWVLVIATGTLGAAETSEVLLEEGTNFAVALSPDGSWIVMDLQGRLWRVPSEGGEGVPLTDGLGDDRLPDWSPDGARLVFQSFRNGTWDLWSIASDGSDLKPITEDRFDDREPVWSPDGSRIAFSSDRSGNYDVWILDPTRGDLRRLTEHPSNDFMPTWSPDGASLAFVSDRGEGGAGELWSIGLESGEEARIASVSGELASPSWSPDGERIVVRRLERRPVTLMGSRFDAGTASDLVEVPVADGEEGKLVPLTREEDVFPFRAVWMADGSLLYSADGRIRRRAGRPSRGSTNDPPSSFQDIPFELRVSLERPAYPRRPAGISEPGSRQPVRGIVRPVLSPDGSMLAFAALGDLWALRAEGGTPIPLTRDEFLDSDPAWSPDGRFLVYTSDRGGTMDLWVKEIEASLGSSDRRLTDAPGAEVGPAWSPDGRTVAYLDERSHLYVVAAEGGAPRRIQSLDRECGLPSWSPDSRRLALAVHEPVSTRFREGANRIGIVIVETGEMEVLEIPEKSIGVRDGQGPAWSPDGSHMAFALDGGLWTLPVSTGGKPTAEPRRVSTEPADFPSWSPDSSALVYLAADRLKRLSLETGETKDIPLELHYRTPPARGKMILRGVRLIDGTGASPRENVDIVIAGNRIEAIVPGGSASEEGVRVVSGEGRTVIPGLIEMHTHLTLPAWGHRQGRVFLSYGVTSMRTPSGAAYRVLEEKESIVSGRRVGPRVFYTGYSFDGDRVYYSDALAIDDREELEKEIERALRLEFDLIKAYVRLPDPLQRRLIEEAHEHGLFVTSHELYPAVALGIDGIEHLWGTSRRGFSSKITDLRRSYGDVVRLVSRSSAFLTPTLLIHGGFGLAVSREPEILEDPRLSLFPQWATQGWPTPDPPGLEAQEQAIRPLLDTVAAMDRAGSRLVAGTDSPIVPYGLSLILEIEQMSAAGLGPLGAIRAATGVAAEALGVSKHLGTVEVGKLADLVLLDGNPAENIRHLRRAREVVIDGRFVSVEQLLKSDRAPSGRH